jgi:Transposase DDE domain
MWEEAPQRTYPVGRLFNALRHVIRYGTGWGALPDLPLGATVYLQSQRWLASGCFHPGIRPLSRVAAGGRAYRCCHSGDHRHSGTLRSTPESSGPRLGYDCVKRTRGSKLHAAVDALGHLTALRVTPADDDDRTEVGHLPEAIQDATGESVTLSLSIRATLADKRRMPLVPRASNCMS